MTTEPDKTVAELREQSAVALARYRLLLRLQRMTRDERDQLAFEALERRSRPTTEGP